MRINKSIISGTVLVIFILACYSSAWVSPSAFWPAVLLNYFIPVVLIGLPVLVILLFKSNRLLAALLGLLMGLGWPFYNTTFGAWFRDSQTSPASNHSVSVLSFNAKLFRMPQTYSTFSLEMIQWVANDSSAIKCIQEFSTNSEWPELDTKMQIASKGYQSYIFYADDTAKAHHPGLAIFSRYRIIGQGEIWAGDKSNASIYADIKIGGDTVRVYNVHLESMNLGKYLGGFNLPGLLASLRDGGINREKQINLLVGHLSNSPYPFILCGDLNELPYSYNVGRLRRLAKNTFESAGSGLGFTYNQLLLPLRIDHQFYSGTIKADRLEVLREMDYSDHFPLAGNYMIPRINPAPKDHLIASGLESDFFDLDTLNTDRWHLVDPVGDGNLLFNSGGLTLSIGTTENHDPWVNGNRATRLLQNVRENVDFTLEVKFTSPLVSGTSYGLMVEESDQKFLRFDVFKKDRNARVFCAYINGTASEVKVDAALDLNAPLWLKIKRTANTWSYSLALEENKWQEAISFYQYLDVQSAGFYAGNFDNHPAHQAAVEYFRIPAKEED